MSKHTLEVRHGASANTGATFAENEPWQQLINEAHEHVNKIRRRKALQPWNFGASAHIGEEIIAEVMNNKPKSAEIAARGLNTGADFAKFMGALMCDLVEGTIEPHVATAACKAGDKLLQVVGMQLKHGLENRDGTKILQLTSGTKE